MNRQTIEAIIKATEEALAELPPVSSSPVPSSAAARPREMWPATVSVSTLAWVAASVSDQQTALCAIGVGAQYDRPQTAAMQAGTAIHNALLPLIARRLPGAVAEHRFAWEGLRGVVDILWPTRGVVELKTTTSASGRSVCLSDYERLQAGMYAAAFGMGCLVVVVVPGRVLYHEPVSGSEAGRALTLLRAYLQVARERPTPPIGNCGKCVYQATCQAKNSNLCAQCLKPLTEDTILWVTSEVGVHACGQAVRRTRAGVHCVRVSGGKLVKRS